MTDPSRAVEIEEKIFRLVSTMVDRSPDDPLPPLVQRRLQARVDTLHAELDEARAALRAKAPTIQDAPEAKDRPDTQMKAAPPDLTKKLRTTGRNTSARSESSGRPSEDIIDKKMKSVLPRGKRGKGHRRIWG
ncbi:MAG TPA: hypothetical protein VFG50_10640 [Rhodothermales bacterium]|nr:hypothetical protein [Rhodothermales bacterium]